MFLSDYFGSNPSKTSSLFTSTHQKQHFQERVTKCDSTSRTPTTSEKAPFIKSLLDLTALLGPYFKVWKHQIGYVQEALYVKENLCLFNHYSQGCVQGVVYWKPSLKDWPWQSFQEQSEVERFSSHNNASRNNENKEIGGWKVSWKTLLFLVALFFKKLKKKVC